ncbi:MAG: 3-keto-5-aminohexanoate cleavage protein [Mesorhizobium sp.]|nr:3-keto-5-aminohexanoate cleavage protein [Mesorhizobium sp.]MCO5164006.1 3-keto-5-aminohexanoate cleavage protein [Mesorhizobium sp.]
MKKTILTAAVTGNITTLAQHPGLPCTPEQIATAAIECGKAGAAVAHIHVRYPDGRPSMEISHYREVMGRIRDSGLGMIVNLTTGPGQRFVPDRENPAVAAPGTTLMHPLRRVEHIAELKPEMCSLDLNTMWSGSSVVINPPENVRIMAKAMREAGTRPEIELFDSGDIHLARALLEEDVFDHLPLFQIVTGVRYGFEATPQTLCYARSLLPVNANWGAIGIGRMSFGMLVQTALMGGHVRVGFEDNLYLNRGALAPDNASLVRKAVHLVEELGGTIASPADARAILGLQTH